LANALSHSSAEYSFKGSRTSLKVPSKRVGSYGIIVIVDLNYCKPKSAILTPSIKIPPDAASSNLKSPKKIVDFPEPVLPTIPIFSVG